ncbi:sugar phosphate isomerase/epimerase family protein [Streptomyces sp. NPDC058045]|uniref:sugar phosphate isomerase/epimerase family protein n=1 Tax=Streptomyces sp. NPDC058045 TaxID=3346311 RepID=UPI0036E097FA
MNFAFSTLGVPGLAVGEVVRLAVGSGFRGVELRAHSEEGLHPGSGAGERAAAVREFADAGVEVLAVAGYERVAAPGADRPVVDGIGQLVELAHDLGASFVRVFPGGGERPVAEADAAVARRMAAAAGRAEDLGVRILLETHDSHRTGAATARALAPVRHPGAGALWDVLHTWLGGERPAESFAALAPYLGYVQVKDVASAEDTTPLPLGAGALPLAEVAGVLGRAGWDGWLCWEYERRWYEDAAPLPPLLAAGRAYLERLTAGAAG